MRIIIIVLLLLAQAGFAWLTNLPQDAGLDVPDGKLNSLSFAPYRENQGPITHKFPTVEQIEEDMQLMASKTHSIRTYASYEGTMPAIAPLAKKYGVSLIQGAWIDNETLKNEKELAALVKSANAYPDIVKRVIVGNEVLLRGELKADKLVDYINQTKKLIKQPVSYADVWSFYIKNPQLIKAVDYVTIHILPYWEDEPIPASEAPAHIERIVKIVKHEMDLLGVNKPILIGETGWPSMGRQRGFAVPTIVNEASVIRGILDVAKRNGFDVNIVEALNQPWKSELEGVVGANWGLISKDRKEVFPLTGKVYENANWFNDLGVALLLSLLIIALSWRVLKQLPPARMLAFIVFAQVLSSLLVSQSEFLWYTSYKDWQREVTLLIVGLGVLLSGLLLRRSLELLAGRELTITPALAKLMNKESLSRASHSIIIAFAGYGFYQSYLLTLNGRYISFPVEACYIPVVGLVGLFLINCFIKKQWTLKNIELNALLGYNNYYALQDKILGCLLVVLSFGVIIGEIRGFILCEDFIISYPSIINRIGIVALYTFANVQLVTWLACLAVFYLAMLINKDDSVQPDWLTKLAYHKLY